MEEDHGRNPEVFDDLLRIDHGTALIGRLADSIAVLGGGRPGRQWPKPVPLYSVLRGAMSRILEYRRIELSSIAKVSVKGIYVEPVIHAAAELLDNATRYSPPQTKVHVTAIEVQTGVGIEIEDARRQPQRGGPRAGRGHAGGGRAGPTSKHRRAPPAWPRRRRPPLTRTRCRSRCGVRVRRRARHPRRAERAAHRGTRQRTRPRHRCRRRAQGRFDGVKGPKRTLKKRRPTTGPPSPNGRLEDDVPEVTEWTANGLPQRRSRVKVPFSQRVLKPAPPRRKPRPREGGPSRHRLDPVVHPGAQEEEGREGTRAVGRGLHGRPQGRTTTTRSRHPARRTVRPPPRPMTRGTSSDPTASQLRLDAQGARPTGCTASAGRRALRRRTAHRPVRR